MSILSLIISILALTLSAAAFWVSNFRKGKPKFVCSRWTAVRMQHASGKILAAFSVHVTVVNDGKKPLEIRDLMLVVDTNEGSPIFYEPIFLWDLRQWIEDADRPDKVGRAQKGQVPLPIQLNANQYYDFGYSILFLPLDHETLVEPLRHSSIRLQLYTLTDRKDDYVQIGHQAMQDQDLKPLLSQAFSGVTSISSIVERPKFIKLIQDEMKHKH